MDDRMLLTRTEAAKRLSISTDTLDRLRNSGQIKAVQIGSRIYFSADVLRAFVTKEGYLC